MKESMPNPTFYHLRAKLRAIVNETTTADDLHIGDIARRETLRTLLQESKMTEEAHG